ncbi:MAG: prepilin-type N-terminal cleavage/methylation domain-containing protein [Planctomycetota bacterium]
MPQPTRHPSRGFTLVEILIVVVILGILASIVIPQFGSATQQSKTAATASIVRTVQAKVFEDFATQGVYASTINDDWFVEGSLPTNPLAPEQKTPVVLYDTAATADMTHPATKIVSATGAFWYNAINGTFRALVPAQGTQAATLELYNTANSSGVANYGDTTD